MKLYYTVDIDYDGDGNCDYWTTGNKFLTVYKIKNDELIEVLNLDLGIEDDSESSIIEELENLNLYQDENIELKWI